MKTDSYVLLADISDYYYYMYLKLLYFVTCFKFFYT